MILHCLQSVKPQEPTLCELIKQIILEAYVSVKMNSC